MLFGDRSLDHTYCFLPQTRIGLKHNRTHGGARQESDKSSSFVSRFGSALPEVLKASTEF